ncbi:hypothetical protein [Mycobacterium sp. E2733]|uniref:hypothetical protein n=1 Tax=Mycobacterium sp. E2733 TaxID=1834138 RepID=UPI0012EA645F|nr:hypothetical protein [Mycobacterium sp. E2733]
MIHVLAHTRLWSFCATLGVQLIGGLGVESTPIPWPGTPKYPLAGADDREKPSHDDRTIVAPLWPENRL